MRVPGWGALPSPVYRHAEASLPRRVDVATILSPFDPVVWFRERAQRVFDLDYRIEIYTPVHKRRYGYYSLPVLVGDRIVARIDLKAERATSTLIVQSAWWQPNATAGDLAGLAQAVLDAAGWQGLDTVSVSSWGSATRELAAELARHGTVASHEHEREGSAARS